MGDTAKEIVGDIWGLALWDYHTGNAQHPLYLHTSYGPPEKVSLEEFYRRDLTFNPLEVYALELCHGRVLDVGAGAGAHSLALQKMGLEVTALEHSPGACQVMLDRGVNQVLEQDFWRYQGGSYDTLLLLMNGAGICGSIEKLKHFFSLLASWLDQHGQILIDSCDVYHLIDKSSNADQNCYGELSYQYFYGQLKGRSFNWLFVDFDRLEESAAASGLHAQLLYQEGEQYLAKLQLA